MPEEEVRWIVMNDSTSDVRILEDKILWLTVKATLLIGKKKLGYITRLSSVQYKILNTYNPTNHIYEETIYSVYSSTSTLKLCLNIFRLDVDMQNKIRAILMAQVHANVISSPFTHCIENNLHLYHTPTHQHCKYMCKSHLVGMSCISVLQHCCMSTRFCFVIAGMMAHVTHAFMT